MQYHGVAFMHVKIKGYLVQVAEHPLSLKLLKAVTQPFHTMA